ncbi:PREDICTED: uncharacterized protein LOC109147029 [Ipomoea nil]|uniref:uncharacterized protein LOC109147029 n=1 Tax=Ipomoea nil TaxID=35883 RepID=UPI000901475A|nr:PREDICTED: uncharacterized protein LOC109147029 [Ipomoea nil]
MQHVHKPDARAVYDWIAGSVSSDMNVELFNYCGRSARREDFVSLLEGNQVFIGILNAWTCVLSATEKSKHVGVPSRFFASISTMLYTVVFHHVFHFFIAGS